MADPAAQSYASHRRFYPLFHFVAFPIFVVNLLWSAWQVFRAPSVATAIGLLVAAGLILLAWSARTFVLIVQDRLIRLEERLRLERLLPPELRTPAASLSRSQLVALRFASDAELPGLVKAVVDEGIHDREAIKKRIRDWRPDHLRA